MRKYKGHNPTRQLQSTQHPVGVARVCCYAVGLTLLNNRPIHTPIQCSRPALAWRIPPAQSSTGTAATRSAIVRPTMCGTTPRRARRPPLASYVRLQAALSPEAIMVMVLPEPSLLVLRAETAQVGGRLPPRPHPVGGEGRGGGRAAGGSGGGNGGGSGGGGLLAPEPVGAPQPPRRAPAAAVVARQGRDRPPEPLALPRAEAVHPEALVARRGGHGPA